MQPTSVFAAAASRLHADLIVIRLRRAGISREKISAIFPERLKPNCALCWLSGQSKPKLYNGETVTIAGPMRTSLSTASESSFVRSLQEIGLGPRDAGTAADRLSRGQILLSVQTDDQEEIAIAWHTFRELEAEGISLALSSAAEEQQTWFGSRRQRDSADNLADLALGIAV